MKLFSLRLFSLLPVLFAGAAFAAPLEGRLELTWGDADPVSGLQGQFRVTLVDDSGLRYRLDAEQARRGAADIYALAGQRVAVDLATAATSDGLAVQAIVPAGEPRSIVQPNVAGTTVWATLLCKFSDIATEQKPTSFFSGQYGNSPGQLDHYWREVSYNKINLTGSAAYGWYTLPQPRSFYVPASGSANLNKLFDDCIAAANPFVNFAANDGLQGVNMMFNGDLDGFAWGGSRCATLDGINKCWSSTWNPPWSFSNSAPLSHEMGHAYGLPHANNSDGDTDPYDNPWDVMSDAWSNAATDTTYGKIAKHISTWSRDKLGFIDAARKRVLNTDGQYNNLALDRASLIGSTNLQMIVVTLPGQPASKFYTIEARKRGGKYESALAGDAVIIHSVDTTRSEPAWVVDATSPAATTSNNEGSMFKVGESWTAPNNAFSVTVNAATTEGFSVSVRRGAGAADPIFRGGFQQ
jgi:M6 family metalloprotease-like protein